MGVRDLIARYSKGRGTLGSAAVKGIPPAGSRVPGVGDGRTTTNRKVKLDQPKPRHRKER